MDEGFRTERLLLRAPREEDVAPLAARLAEPEVARWWPRFDAPRVRAELVLPRADTTVWVLQHAGAIVGAILACERGGPDARHAALDLFVGTAWQGRGLSSEAIRAVVAHLVERRGHHRLIVDPAADNVRAIRACTHVGFRLVGVLRQSVRGPDGRWHDRLLMELLAAESTLASRRAEAG